LIFKLGDAGFFEDVEFARGDMVKDFVIKEEYPDISTGVIDIAQDLFLDFVQGIINHDNV
jgi:hypothetical protein